MKQISFIISLLAIFSVLSCAPNTFADDEREAKPRGKGGGMELYSWKNEKNEWFFVLTESTNIIKSTDDIKNSKKKLKGIESLKKEFKKLAKGQAVSWLNRSDRGGFEFPKKAVQKEIAAAAKVAAVELSLPETEE